MFTQSVHTDDDLMLIVVHIQVTTKNQQSHMQPRLRVWLYDCTLCSATYIEKMILIIFRHRVEHDGLLKAWSCLNTGNKCLAGTRRAKSWWLGPQYRKIKITA